MALISVTAGRVLLFSLRFWRPHSVCMLLSAFLTLFSTSLGILVPHIARTIASFDYDVQAADTHWSLSVFPAFISASPPGLVAHCILLAAIMVFYHTSSFMAHKTAYEAGQRVHNTIVTTVIAAILEAPHLDRISSINPIKLSQVIVSSARTSADVVGALLTDVLSSLCTSISLLGVLLYMSASLTVTIGVVLVSSQLTLLGTRRHQRNRSKEMLLAESNLQALGANALHRGVTVRVFHAEPLILSSLQKRLQHLSKVKADVVTAIHGQTGFSSLVTGLLFVLVLGMTNYYRWRGELNMVDIVMYYLFLYQFINRLLGLQHECQQTLTLLESLQTLQRLVSWYEVEHIVRQRLDSPHPVAPAKEASFSVSTARDDSQTESADSKANDAPILMENVTYAYPEIPSFLSDALENNVKDEISGTGGGSTSPTHARHTNCKRGSGVHDVSCTIQAGRITALYGPSGSGKSTCLRILAGVLQPQKGRVSTRAKVALLEQQQAVLLGSVADNILMEDTSALSGIEAERVRRGVELATRQSGCDAFLNDPFTEFIHSPDKTQFSGGQLQRICMARLFARRECTLLLLDEPTTGLDAENVQHLLSTLTELNNTHHKTIVVATHDERVASIAHDIIRFQND